ncbi:MAG: hypothetical protein FJY37_10905 [Betaproteobacteria bacterium]|nr:hypothetical protein [Betaproteobacteria bacterium]
MKKFCEHQDSKVLMTEAEIELVSGGRFKRPLQPPITVYYDDGVSVWTSDPASTNVHPVIK